MFRSLVAGRSMLIVLDNVVSAAQAHPLLPGSPSCAVVVTSRSRLVGRVTRDGATRVELDVLPPTEAVGLLSAIIGEERVRQESEIAAELARRCDYLPLALRIAAERVASSVHTRLADLVEELGHSQDRLSALELDEDELATVRTVYSWSHKRTRRPSSANVSPSEPAYRPGLEHRSCGSTTGLSGHLRPKATGRSGGRSSHRGERPGWYSFHALLREYARECARNNEPDAEIRAAIERLLAWYLRSADAATDRLPHRHRAAPPRHVAGITPLRFVGLDDALAWCEAERANFTQRHGRPPALPESATNSAFHTARSHPHSASVNVG